MTKIRSTWLLTLVIVFQASAADEPSSVKEALRGLNSEDSEYWEACTQYLGQHYREAKLAMIDALECDHGRFSIGLAGAFALAGDQAIPDLLKSLQNGKKLQKINAAEAIAQMAQLGKRAKPAVTALHGELNSTDFEVREAVLHALGQIRDVRSLRLVPACLKDKHPAVRGAAIWALCQFEARAEPAALAILHFAKDEFSRRPDDHMDRAFLSLGMIGKSALKLIGKEITDKNNPAELREYFLKAINYMANHGKKGDVLGAIPALRKATEDSDPALRRAALGTLDIVCGLNSDLDPDKHLDWLFQSEKLKNLSGSERVQAASIAAIFTKHRKLAIRIFNEGLHSHDPNVVRRAVAGCLSLGEDRPAVAAGLERAMRISDSDVRWLAVRRVTADPRYAVAIPTLIWIAVFDQNESCRRDAVAALAMVSDAIWRRLLFPDSLRKVIIEPYSILFKTLGALAGWR